jgi:hypothetical protein
MEWKKGPHTKEKKSLSTKGLLNALREAFNKISTSEKPKGRQNITLQDCLMSALAMFSLKSPSLLAFDLQRAEPIVKHNLRSLYGVENVPSDTYMRERLDLVDPKELREGYLSIFRNIQDHKLLERYSFLGGYLCLVDGTELFNSERIHCKNCCDKHHKDGRVTYHHQMLAAAIAHPEHSQVIPLCPEPITKQDGAVKNDCERNACHRFLRDLKREHPRLKLTLVSDALSANAPHINELKDFGYSYIIAVKTEGNRTLFDWVKEICKEEVIIVGKNRYTFRYVNEVPLNETKVAPNVNFFECEAVEITGRKVTTKRFAWVTDHVISRDNLYDLHRGGRARWKVENETFNTLKNQGYQFEHNFGHGKKNLHTVFAFLMMFAFLIDQVQEAACGLFQAALKRFVTRRALWERLRGFFYMGFIESWQALWQAMSGDYQGFTIYENTS